MAKSFALRLKDLFKIKKFDENFFEELEDLLIEGDLGSLLAMEISDNVRSLAKSEKQYDNESILELMKKHLSSLLLEYKLELVDGKTNIFLILGVNGVGKTTTIAKMATYYQNQNKRVLLAAGDTFRAAAIDQLELHAQRTNSRIVKQTSGSDPAAVIFDAIDSAVTRKEDLILADTAGRMHNKEHLLRQLQKIDKIITSKIEDPGAYKKILVLDATTGQNGISQTKLFNEAIGVDAIILTKYDSNSKGGTLIQICNSLKVPIAFIGDGESYKDFRPFDKREFLNSLLGIG
ncbi:MAG: signal recognition particle-docking protein FtsY [Sphaerochaetaceae bacterium]|jgi:fused signal recognition particle receptor